MPVPDPLAAAAPARRPRPFASPRTIRNLAKFLLYLGVLAAVGGIAYDINGATRAGADVEVAVEARGGAVLEVSGTDVAGDAAEILVTQGAGFGLGFTYAIPGVEGGNYLTFPRDALVLSSWGSTVPEHLLNRGHFAIGGLCLLAGALLLRRLLVSINEGRPFRRGNAVRIAGIGALVVVNAVSQVLPTMGSTLVLERVGLDGADSPVMPADPSVSWSSLVVALLLLALAEVFRRGTELADDVEGLV